MASDPLHPAPTGAAEIPLRRLGMDPGGSGGGGVLAWGRGGGRLAGGQGGVQPGVRGGGV